MPQPVQILRGSLSQGQHPALSFAEPREVPRAHPAPPGPPWAAGQPQDLPSPCFITLQLQEINQNCFYFTWAWQKCHAGWEM